MAGAGGGKGRTAPARGLDGCGLRLAQLEDDVPVLHARRGVQRCAGAEGLRVGEQFAEDLREQRGAHVHLLGAERGAPLHDRRGIERGELVLADEEKLARGVERGRRQRVGELRRQRAQLLAGPPDLCADARDGFRGLSARDEIAEQRGFEIEPVELVAHVVRVLADELREM